jgi:hypothetical protein
LGEPAVTAKHSSKVIEADFERERT